MVLYVLSCNSLQIRVCHTALSSTVRQCYFQGIDVDPITDPPLKSIKIVSTQKARERKTNRKASAYLKRNSTEITG